MVKQDDLKISHLCILFADTVFILTLFILTQFFVNIDALYYRSSQFKKMAYKRLNCARTASPNFYIIKIRNFVHVTHQIQNLDEYLTISSF